MFVNNISSFVKMMHFSEKLIQAYAVVMQHVRFLMFFLSCQKHVPQFIHMSGIEFIGNHMCAQTPSHVYCRLSTDPCVADGLMKPEQIIYDVEV